MTSSARSRFVLLWTLTVLVLLADQASKYGMFAWLAQEGDHYVVIPGFFKLIHNRLNEGAVFGMGNTFGGSANLFFAGFSLLALGFIVYWSMQREVKESWWLAACLGLIAGGALGNLYDRLVFKGVRDFLWIHNERGPDWTHFNFAVFNFADTCLVTGAIMLLLHTFFVPRTVDKSVEAGSAPIPTQD